MTTIQEIVDFMRADVDRMCERRGVMNTKLVADRRIAIMLSQIGDVSRFAYSDKEVEPGHRGYKTPEEEASSYGHALLQLAACAAARGVDLQRGLEMAWKAVEERDWAHRAGQEDGKVQGLVGSWHWHGDFVEATLVRYVPGGIITGGTGRVENLAVLFSHATSEATPTMLSPMTTVVVAEQGGTMCHAAIVCREWVKNCVVGTGPIPWPDGTRVRIWNDGRIEKVGA